MADALRKPAFVPPRGFDTALRAPAIRRLHHRREQQPDPAVVERVRGEFNEMRGFSPTPGQAARLFGLSTAECDRVLELLAREGFLRLSADGRYRVAS